MFVAVKVSLQAVKSALTGKHQVYVVTSYEKKGDGLEREHGLLQHGFLAVVTLVKMGCGKMTQTEFINKMIGKPWVDRASSFEECDCWGLVLLYYKEVLNIDLPVVKGFTEKEDFLLCYESGVQQWQEVKTPITQGLAFTSYKGDTPTHVGVCIGNGMALHCRGSVNQAGSVEVHSLRAIESIYGKITYHQFTG